MSHAFAIVLISPVHAGHLRTAVEVQLAPHDEARQEYDPQDESALDRTLWWDWWRIGGRWDGRIRGLDYESAPGCQCAVAHDGLREITNAGADCHYKSNRHDSLERNSIPVLEVGECRPFTLLTPSGEFSHRTHFVPDPGARWPWKYVENDQHDRWCAEQLLKHRDCIAVGIDYHS